jgi:hypothetical protein
MNLREASAVQCLPQDKDEAGAYYCLGGYFYKPDGKASWVQAGKVTRITVTETLAGLHCNMDEVSIYVGDDLVWQAPRMNCESVTYAMPKQGAA